MNSCEDTARAVGCPIRVSTDQSLLAAPHGFSQRATSFIASWCQGIHRMPFSYSIQCPSAEADEHTMHRNHPQTVPGTGPLEATPKPRRSFRQEPFFAHNRIPSGPPLHPSLAQQIKPPTKQDRSHASEPSPHDCWGAYPEGQLSRSDMQPNDGTSIKPRFCNHGSTSITRAQRRTRT